jgi:carbonic anhydrase
MKAEHPHQTRELMSDLAAHGQTPLAAVLGCSDSRAPIEELFDLGFGDLFVIRAAGAVPGVDQVGSIEYAVAHLGVPLVLVLSHTNCGAVTAALQGADEPGALGELLSKLNPVVQYAKDIDEAKRLDSAVEYSSVLFSKMLGTISPVLKEAVDSKKVAIISGVYDIATGKVTLSIPGGIN